jgi:hypothetical protein
VFVEPVPSGYSCTIASVLAPKWRISWNTLTPFWNPIFVNDVDTKASLYLYNYGTGSEFVDETNLQLTPLLPTSEPDRWFNCNEIPDDGSSTNVIDCTWQLDLATGYFAVNQTWLCSDKDPEHP